MFFAGTSAETVTEITASIEGLAVALYGTDSADPVILSMSSKLYKITVIKSCKELSTKYKTTMKKLATTINGAIVTLSREVVALQSFITLLTGKTLKLSKLTYNQISVSTGSIVLLGSNVSTSLTEVWLTFVEFE